LDTNDAVTDKATVPLAPAVNVIEFVVDAVIVPPAIDHAYCSVASAATVATLPIDPAGTEVGEVITGAAGTAQVMLQFEKAIEDGRGRPFVAS
jgi:hypothetical protein